MSTSSNNYKPGKGKHLDGRVLRAEENRRKVAQAMLDLLREGGERPTRQAVAKKAGLALRTVYHHFDNLEDLHEEASKLQYENYYPLIQQVPNATDELEARILLFMDLRAELYEQMSPVRRNAMLWIHRSQALADNIFRLSQKIREQLVTTFEPELNQVEGIEREQVIDALEASTSWDAWNFLREGKHYSRERAYRAMKKSLEGILCCLKLRDNSSA